MTMTMSKDTRRKTDRIELVGHVIAVFFLRDKMK